MRFRKRLSSRAICLLLCALLLSGAASVAQAQSGRRIPKRPPSEPLPTKETEPPIEESKPKDDKPQIPIVVTKDVPNVTISTVLVSRIMQACMKRLGESLSIKPVAARDMNRKQASDAAKASADSYALLIQLEIDYASGRSRDQMGYVNARDLYIRYELFSPATGKTKTSGQVYQRYRAVGGVPVPVPNSELAAEYALIEAGRETADRVIDAIGLPAPAERRF